MKYKLSIESLEDIELGGQDDPYEEKFFPNYDYEKDEIYVIGRYQYGTPLPLTELIAHLTKLQSNSCTHVSMNFHEDHLSYHIEGLRITTVNEDHIL
jgi:hypothetical protein